MLGLKLNHVSKRGPRSIFILAGKVIDNFLHCNFVDVCGMWQLDWCTDNWNHVNSLRPRRNRCYNADDIFKCIFLKENVWIPTKISLKFVPKGPINNIPAMVQTMAWRRPGDKPLSEPMMVSLLTHICVTLPQWVNWLGWYSSRIFMSS